MCGVLRGFIDSMMMGWGIFVIVVVVVVQDVVADNDVTADGCAKKNIYLESLGLSSQVTVPLTSNHEVCVLNVVAPDTHLVNVQFLDATPELEDARFFNYTQKSPPCLMSIFLPQNAGAIWVGDPCSIDFLPDLDLLTSQFRILWTPPKNPLDTKGRKVVLTAVGKGDVCKNRTQHICSRIGWEPNMCVSKTLVCDGVENCPKGSSMSDEDDRLCKTNLQPRRSWEQFVFEMVKKLKPVSDLKTEMMNNKWFQEKLKERGYTSTPPTKVLVNWKDWEELKITQLTTKPPIVQEKHSTAESIAEVLSHYGPWGYVMLGMLICGTVLMFCGLWECCFRRPKPQDDDPVQMPPTTVLIINQQDEASSAHPPSYEDLDQPPSYSVLFPNLKQCERTSSEVPNVPNSDRQDEEVSGASARDIELQNRGEGQSAT